MVSDNVPKTQGMQMSDGKIDQMPSIGNSFAHHLGCGSAEAWRSFILIMLSCLPQVRNTFRKDAPVPLRVMSVPARIGNYPKKLWASSAVPWDGKEE